MTQFFRIIGALSACTLLGACSFTGNDNFYQNDGPPSGWTSKSEADPVTPRAENFYPASLRPYTVMGQRYVPITSDIPMVQTGIGSWYGKQFHGNKTAIGEIYNMHQMSAAHPTMPLPSYARVTNLENGKSTIVRVNDRGPFLHNRIIDLSYAAATELGYANKGTAKLRVERLTNANIANGNWKNGSMLTAENTTSSASAVSGPTSVNEPSYTAPAAKGWGAQIGFFSDANNAQQYGAHAEAVLSVSGHPETVRIVKDNGGYRVIVGSGMNRDTARNFAQSLKDRLGTNAFIVMR